VNRVAGLTFGIGVAVTAAGGMVFGATGGGFNPNTGYDLISRLLAIIILDQPITRAEIAARRMADSDRQVQVLLRHRLIREEPRAAVPGRGIPLMKAYMDDMHFERDGSEVHMRKRARSGAH